MPDRFPEPDLDPEWGKDDASEPPGFRDQWVNAAGQACGMYGPAAAPAPCPAPQGAAGMTEERLAEIRRMLRRAPVVHAETLWATELLAEVDRLRASTGGADATLREQRDEALAALGIRPDEEGGWAFQNGWCRDLSEAIERAKWAVASEAARAVRAALSSPPTPEQTP